MQSERTVRQSRQLYLPERDRRALDQLHLAERQQECEKRLCALIWINLNTVAKTVGGIWFVLGLAYATVKTRGFRAAPAIIDFSSGGE